MSTNDDTLLRAAWEDFCEQLKGAGRLPFRPNVPTGDLKGSARRHSRKRVVGVKAS